MSSSGILSITQQLAKFAPTRYKKKKHEGNLKRGHEPTPMMLLSSKISWVQFQLRSAQGNISHATHQMASYDGATLDETSWNRRDQLVENLQALVKVLECAEAEIAEFNRTKKLRRV